MKKVYVLYNPKSGKGTGEIEAKNIEEYFSCEIVYSDITKMQDYYGFFSKLSADDSVVVSGGDGTLSFFAHNVGNLHINNPVYYYAKGSGNDFLKDMNYKKGDRPFLINDYIQNTPVMTVGNEDYRFVNGVGGGLDAYACIEGNKQHEKGKSGNYVLSAIKGILWDYKPMNATVTVDGAAYEFKNVWFASVMKGRFFGGGIMLAPKQYRESGKLSIVIVHSVKRLKLLTIIPGAFKGKHVKYTQFVKVIEGSNITVEFDRAVPLQFDGETVEEVNGYSVELERIRLAM